MADFMSMQLPRAEVQKVAVASMLKGIDRYNPENLPTLESYIETQARENAYDLEANLAVLKVYQFNPQLYRTSIVQLILFKALTNLPHTDFVLCKCLIERHNLESREIKPIVYLHDLLETCAFTVFWNTLHRFRKDGVEYLSEPPPKKSGELADNKSGDQLKSLGIKSGEVKPLDISKEIDGKKDPSLPPSSPPVFLPFDNIVGFSDSIRKFICHVVNITYQRIDKASLAEFLDLHDYHLHAWMNKYNWKELADGNILIGNQEESIKTKNITEKIEFENVAAIMSSAR